MFRPTGRCTRAICRSGTPSRRARPRAGARVGAAHDADPPGGRPAPPERAAPSSGRSWSVTTTSRVLSTKDGRPGSRSVRQLGRPGQVARPARYGSRDHARNAAGTRRPARRRRRQRARLDVGRQSPCAMAQAGSSCVRSPVTSAWLRDVATGTLRVRAPGGRATPEPGPRDQIWPPVVLAPMAGITNVAFRRLCREQGAGLYVCEMITTRALVERNPKTLRDDRVRRRRGAPRSLQLYGVDPDVDGRRRADGRRGGPGRPHRPQLRLPGAQGDPHGRRLGAALAAQAVRPHRAGRRCEAARAGRRPGHDQDAQGHRRRPSDVRRSRA